MTDLFASERRVAVVGAGIVGTGIAYELRKRGAVVTLIDRNEPGTGCSFGNSGAISPASVAPLAMPGVVASVPAMLRDRDGPLYLPLAYLPRALPWLLRFVASARPARVKQSAVQLAAIHANALDLHEAMAAELGVPELFLRRGHLHLYRDDAALEKDAAGWRLREDHGWKPHRLDRAAIEALEPHAPSDYRLGMYLADHATILDPFAYVQAMAHAYVTAGGVLEQREVNDLAQLGRDFDAVVVAAGAWSPRLLRTADVALPLESQRGYHVQFQGGPPTVSRTVVLTDRKVFVTPMREGLRVGGTVEIGGLDAPPDPRRADLLHRLALEAFPQLAGVPHRSWMGHRPCMPDSVPVVGLAPGHLNLWIATGHGHLGLTDSLGTALRIADGILPATPEGSTP